jgi:radical SAM family protein
MNVNQCDQPWFELQLQYDELVRCCCYFLGPEDRWDGQSPFSVPEAWNSPTMRLKRRVVASGDERNSGCQRCQALRYGTGPRFGNMPAGLNARQRTNWERAQANFDAHREVVDSWPVKYYMNFGLACNIDCIMCTQTPDRRKDKRQLSAARLLEMKETMSMANEFAIIGGEPFSVRNAREFIEAVLADPIFADVLLTLYTNGTLLHRHLDQLTAQRRVGITVSLDSIGETYEYIRRLGRWKVVEKNILDFKETGARCGLEWGVHIACVVMKSSVSNLVPFVDWCIAHDCPVHFVPMQTMTALGLDTDAEDFFRFPHLLDEIPGWRDGFDEAIAKLERKGWLGAGAGALRQLKGELEAGWQRWREESAAPTRSAAAEIAAEPAGGADPPPPPVVDSATVDAELLAGSLSSASLAQIRQRIARLLNRDAGVDAQEIDDAVQVLLRLLGSRDSAQVLQSGAIPAALEPLLIVYMGAVWRLGDPSLAVRMEQLYGAVSSRAHALP